MVGTRWSTVKTTSPWLAVSVAASATLVYVGWSGNPVGLVMIAVLPFLFWVAPLASAWRGKRALGRFADEISDEINEEPEYSCAFTNEQKLRWAEHDIEAVARSNRGFDASLVVREGDESARFSLRQARRAARAALEGRIRKPKPEKFP
jgi:hypothetical protein